jgi:tetratricopeptide (TPR) repeat protein
VTAAEHASPGRGAPGRLPLEAAAWEKLRDAVELGQGRFALLAVEAPTPFIAVELARRFADHGLRTHLDRFTGDQAGAHDWAIPTPADVWIIAAEEDDEGPLTRGWQRTFRGLNRIRNHLQRSFEGALLVVGGAWFHRLAWEEASDLWSVREGPYRFALPEALLGLPQRLDVWTGFRKTPPEMRATTDGGPSFQALALQLEAQAQQLDALGFAPEADLCRVRALAARARFQDRRPLMDALRAFTHPRVATRARLEWVILAEDCLHADTWKAELNALVQAAGPDRIDRLLVHWTATERRLLPDEVRAHLDAMGAVAADGPGRRAWHLAWAQQARTTLGDVEEAARRIEAARAEAPGPWADDLDVEIEANQLADLSRPAGEGALAWGRLAARAEAVGAILEALGCRALEAGLLNTSGQPKEAAALRQALVEAYDALDDQVAGLGMRMQTARRLGLEGQIATALAQQRELEAALGGLGQRRGAAMARLEVAQMLDHQGAREGATLRAAAEAVFLELGDPEARARALLNTASFWNRQRDFDRALPLLAEAQRLLVALNDLDGQAQVRAEVATSLLTKGDFEQALREAQQAQDVFGRLGQVHNHASATALVGMAFGGMGQLGAARAALEAALRAQTELANPREEAISQAQLAEVHEAQGDVAQAIELYREATCTLDRLGSHRDAAATGMNLARLLLQTGALDEAEAVLEQALAVYEQADARLGQADALLGLGALALQRGRPLDALRGYRRALRLGRELKNPTVTAEAGDRLLSIPGAVTGPERLHLAREVARARAATGAAPPERSHRT